MDADVPSAPRAVFRRQTSKRPLAGAALALLLAGLVVYALGHGSYLLDEPVNPLDLANQLEVLTLIRRTARDKELVTLAVLHDLNLALRFADRFLQLDGVGGRRAGSMTPVGEATSPDARFPGLPLDWSEWRLAELPGRILADHRLERCLALAVINAISQYRLASEELAGVEIRDVRASVVRWVAEQDARRLVVIGNMGPLVSELAEAGVPHVVFERNPGNRTGALPDAQERAWLPRADRLILTGATLLNHTLAPILALAREARVKLLVGFSARAHPAFLAGCGVTHTFSVHIREIDRIRRLLQVGNWNHMLESQTA